MSKLIGYYTDEDGRRIAYIETETLCEVTGAWRHPCVEDEEKGVPRCVYCHEFIESPVGLKLPFPRQIIGRGRRGAPRGKVRRPPPIF